MKILFLLPDFPYPPRGGALLRTMGVLEGVAAEHEVHVISFGADVPEETPIHQMVADLQIVPPPRHAKTDRLRTLLLSRHADMARRRWSDAFLAAIEAKLNAHQFDIVQFENLEMTPYIANVRRWQPAAKLIYDSVNAEADLQYMAYQTDRQKLRRLPYAVYSWIQSRRIRRLEAWVGREADLTVAVSEEDARLLTPAMGNKLVVVPNGIHVKAYQQPEPLDLKPNALVFTGIMDYRPNVDGALWFAEDVLPQLSDVHLYLVGKRPHPRIAALKDDPNITVTGTVPEVTPYLFGATIFVVPLRIGSGTRLKILEAMAAGCAIVSTRVGASGLGVTDGEQLLLADDPTTFAAAIRSLLDNPDRRQLLAEKGRQFVQQHFDWSVIVPRLLAAYHHK